MLAVRERPYTGCSENITVDCAIDCSLAIFDKRFTRVVLFDVSNCVFFLRPVTLQPGMAVLMEFPVGKQVSRFLDHIGRMEKSRPINRFYELQNSADSSSFAIRTAWSQVPYDTRLEYTDDVMYGGWSGGIPRSIHCLHLFLRVELTGLPAVILSSYHILGILEQSLSRSSQ